ncbi:MAG: FHA domain-containing protein [Minicystis sp.]
MSGLEFRIRHPDGKSEQLVVDSDRVLIGSGAHCEIRLPAAEASVEHVLVTFLGGGVFATARALSPPPTINGSPFTQAPLLAESVLGVGQVQMTISVVEVAENANVIKKKQESTSPMTYVLAAVAIPLSLYIILDDPPSETAVKDRPKEVPSLWAAAAPSCPQRAADQAAALAREKRVIAEGKRERSPFHVQDGVAAVPLFRTAAACYKNAEDLPASRDMEAAAQRLTKSLEEEYRAHQMRLEHAIEVKDLRTAQKEVKVLLAMLQGQNNPYVVWLSNLDRRLQLKLGGKVGG